MSRKISRAGRALIAAHFLLIGAKGTRADASARDLRLRAVLISAEQATPEQLRRVTAGGIVGVVLALIGESGEQKREETAAAHRVRELGLDLYYWIEIGRCPVLAEAHPEWMASVQGHTEWRRFFRGFPLPRENEVVKVYPWVPILYQEAFEAHRHRVRRLLQEKPTPKGIFLNDLQGAPSACGCGNVLCRWTADYGPVRTATPAGTDAAARFVGAIRAVAPDSEIIPVWTTECEQHDAAADGACAGVGCFQGRCWKEFSAQLTPVMALAPKLAVLLPYREFRRDQPRYGPEAGWIRHALASFAVIPPQHEGSGVPANRLIAILQGWDVTDEQVQAQIARTQEAGAAGYVVSRVRIDQTWQPRTVRP